jgi:hypothetical protein
MPRAKRRDSVIARHAGLEHTFLAPFVIGTCIAVNLSFSLVVFPTNSIDARDRWPYDVSTNRVMFGLSLHRNCLFLYQIHSSLVDCTCHIV